MIAGSLYLQRIVLFGASLVVLNTLPTASVQSTGGCGLSPRECPKAHSHLAIHLTKHLIAPSIFNELHTSDCTAFIDFKVGSMISRTHQITSADTESAYVIGGGAASRVTLQT